MRPGETRILHRLTAFSQLGLLANWGASPVTGAADAGQSWCLTRAIAGKTLAVRLNA
jgi:hypothetical protein